MSEEKKRLFNERLARYQATIALEPTDRMIVGGTGSNYFAEAFAGYNRQETIYDGIKWLDTMSRFAESFPEVDLLRTSRSVWAPLVDAVGYRLYKIPGRDLPPDIEFQFVETEWMKIDDYDLLIRSLEQFMMERYLPRVLAEFEERGSARSYIAFLKSGMAYVMRAQQLKQWSVHMEREYGLPSPLQGVTYAPFDVLADKLRGLQGIMIDIHERPEKVIEACNALIPHVVNTALAGADPLKRLPIFIPLHRGCHPFLSPRQFDAFYWPSLKKVTMMLIEAGYTIRAYLEGDWTPNWHHYNEFPRGKIICDMDNKADIFRARAEIGNTVCLGGGIPDSMFILGTPEQVRSRVRQLCETAGKDGGLIINGGCAIPYDTRTENFRAYVDATLEYGRYSDTIRPELKPVPEPVPGHPALGLPQKTITPWEVKLEEMGGVIGDEELIKNYWEMLEAQAYSWLLFWAW